MPSISGNDMETYIPISYLNDFIFCPRSIYFHQLYADRDASVYKQSPQYAGEAAHVAVDHSVYSSRATLLQGADVFCERYGIAGKIDLFDIKAKKLVERKRSITKIYDGYVFQVYAQYFALVEMGYRVEEIIIHDLSHNKNFPVSLPEDDREMFRRFERLISDLKKYSIEKDKHIPNRDKCIKCIYSELCDISLC